MNIQLAKKIFWKLKHITLENRGSRVLRFHLAWQRYANAEGLTNSICKNSPQDRKGNPSPWISLGCINFLDNLDLSDFTVCELGSGASTLFWAQRVSKVSTFEHSEYWLNKLIKNSQYSNITGKSVPENYSFNSFESFNTDIIMIDGLDRTSAIKRVHELIITGEIKPKLIIFDNADWYPKSVELLSGLKNYIPIDFGGFAPMGMGETLTRVYTKTDGDIGWITTAKAVRRSDRNIDIIERYSLE
jgi:hypothetical protein